MTPGMAASGGRAMTETRRRGEKVRTRVILSVPASRRPIRARPSPIRLVFPESPRRFSGFRTAAPGRNTAPHPLKKPALIEGERLLNPEAKGAPFGMGRAVMNGDQAFPRRSGRPGTGAKGRAVAPVR